MILKLLIALFFLTGGVSLYQALSSIREEDRFSPALLARAKGEKEAEFPPELLPLLNQPFHYIGHGAQAIAMASQDDQYVLKFFLMQNFEGKKRFKIKSPLRLISSYREKREQEKGARHERNLEKIATRYEVAFEKLQEETALLALHFHKTETLPLCTFTDRRGKQWQVDLNQICFLLQKKVTPLPDLWRKCTTVEEKEKVLSALEKILDKRARKGFADVGEEFFSANYGFLENQAILLDAGRVVYSEEIEKNPTPEIEEMKKKLQRAML